MNMRVLLKFAFVIALSLLETVIPIMAGPSEDTLTRPKPADPERVRSLLDKLASDKCEIRRDTIYELYSAYAQADMMNFISVFEKELATRQNSAATKGRLVLRSLRQDVAFYQGRGWGDWMGSKLGRALSAPENQRQKEFQNAKKELLRLVRDSKTTPETRAAAVGVMVYLVDHYGDPHGKAQRMGLPIADWKKTLLDLLKDSDQQVALAVAIGISSMSSFKDVDKSQLVPKLINGLRHEDFGTRLDALRALTSVTGRQFCVDPTDELSARAEGIAQWERWWQTTQKE